MLGQRRLTETDQVLELADSLFTTRQLAQDHKTVLVAHGLEQGAGPQSILF